MKKFISIIIFLVCALFSFGCYSVAEPLKGNLFDEEVLAEYELSWLKKPEKVTDEEQSTISSEYYVYKTYISSIEEYERYVNKFLDRLLVGDYTVGAYFENGEYGFHKLYTKIHLSTEKSDYWAFKEPTGEQEIYAFYSKSKPSCKINESVNGYPLSRARYINISLRIENGKYLITISLKKSENIFVNPIS